MNKELKKILGEYTNDEKLLERILVSLFVKSNGLNVVKNRLIKSYLLTNRSIYFHLLNRFQIKFGFDELIEAFELIVPVEDKVVNGAVYTPNYIKEYIVQEGFKKYTGDVKKITVGDISCGCGGFLVSAADKIKSVTGKSYSHIFKDNIYGLDISGYSISRAKILLSLLAIINGEDQEIYDFNLFVGNALNFDWKQKVRRITNNKGFDLIVGNPPYVRAKNIDNRDKKYLQNWGVTKSGMTDLYIPFFEIGLRNIKEGGTLGYITVNTFYKSVNARALRVFLQANSFDLRIIDFGNEKLFGKKSTYTCICLITKQSSAQIKFIKTNSNSIRQNKKLDYGTIAYASLDAEKGWLLNTSEVIENIKKIEQCGTPLGKLFPIKNGIATLSNDIYIFKPTGESINYYLLERDGEVFKIEKAICRDIIKPNVLKSEKEIKKIKEKLIYPYTNGISPLTLMTESVFQAKYPFAYKYLKTNKEALSKRDKGNGDYGAWYAFGRTQALNDKGYKLLFPYMAKEPLFIYTDDKSMLIYCGYAIFSDSPENLFVLKKVLSSSIFSYYIKNTSKPYSAGYYSYAKNYVKNFGICNFTEAEKKWLLSTSDKNEIDDFLWKKYNLHNTKVDSIIHNGGGPKVKEKVYREHMTAVV